MDVKQRVEIISSDLEALKAEVEQGGGAGDSYTKAEADDKFAEKATTYTKSEVDSAIAAAGGGDVVVSGDDVKTKNAGLGKGILIGNQAGFNSSATDNPQIAIGVRAGIAYPQSGEYPIAIGYQASGKYSDIVIGTNAQNVATSGNVNTLLGKQAQAGGSTGVGIGFLAKTGISSCVAVGYEAGSLKTDKSVYIGGACRPSSVNDTSTGQIAIGYINLISGNYAMAFGNNLTVSANQVVLGKFNEGSNAQSCFIVGNGTDSNNKSNLVEITTPLKVSTAGIEANGAFYTSTASSTETLPSAGTGTTFDTGIEWTYIQTMNDFILDSSGEKIKFRYGFTKGSKLHYFGYALDSDSVVRIAHLELGAPTGSGTTALATWISSGAIPTT